MLTMMAVCEERAKRCDGRTTVLFFEVKKEAKKALVVVFEEIDRWRCIPRIGIIFVFFGFEPAFLEAWKIALSFLDLA